jgi:hypothetical protein
MSSIGGRNLRTRILAVVAMLFLGMAGCGDSQLDNGLDDDPSDSDQTVDGVPAELIDKEGLHVLPWIDFVDIPEEYASDVHFDPATERLTLSGAAADAAADVGRGDIVYGHANGGFSRQVKSVEYGADSVVFETRDVILTNVIYGEWDMQLPVGGEGMTDDGLATRHQPLSLGARFNQIGGVGLSISEARMEFGMEPNFDFEGYIKIRGGPISTEHGSSCRDALVDNEYLCAFGRCGGELKVCVDYLKAGLDVSVTPSLAAELSADVKLEKKYPKDPYPIIERNFPGAPLGSTPFTISPKVFITAQANAWAEGKGTLDIGAGGSVGGPVGFEYANGDMRVLNPVSDGYNNLELDEPTTDFEVEAGLGFTLSTGVEFGLSIVRLENRVQVGGLKGAVDLKAEARYKPFETDVCLEADLVLNPFVEAEAKLEIDASPIFDFVKVVGSARQDIAKATLAAWDGGGRFCLEDEPDPPAEVEVVVEWTSETLDLDLLMNSPDAVDYRDDSPTSQGWMHDGDACPEQFGTGCTDVPEDGVFSESIELAEGFTKPSGASYEIEVETFKSESGGGSFQVYVFEGGNQVKQFSGTAAAEGDSETFTFSL